MAAFIFKKKNKKKDKNEGERKKRPERAVLKTQKRSSVGLEKKESLKAEDKKGEKSILASKVLIAPHITEKSTSLAERGIYVFKVSKEANKILVKKAINELYGFKPRKVRILNMPSKKRNIRGILGYKPGYKKAMVYLNKEDKIELA